METVFASQSGCVRNTTIATHAPHVPVPPPHHEPEPTTDQASGLGGQIGELAAALNVIGWNHNQVPAEERVPAQEQERAADHVSDLGGQIGELAAALNVIGWNHNQVPAEERVPVQERT